MTRVPKGRYTKELREQAMKLVLVDGLSQREAAARLSLSVKTLGAWVVAARKGTLADVGKTQRPPGELGAELARVNRELATVTMERDILENTPRDAPLPEGQKLPGTATLTAPGGSGRQTFGDSSR